jgi:hypothetical protein
MSLLLLFGSGGREIGVHGTAAVRVTAVSQVTATLNITSTVTIA